MTQPQTWAMHFAAGLIAAFVATLATGAPIACAVAVGAYWLGRERRDHELKARLKAAEWGKGWLITNWSVDTRNDLVTGVAGAGIGAWTAALILGSLA